MNNKAHHHRNDYIRRKKVLILSLNVRTENCLKNIFLFYFFFQKVVNYFKKCRFSKMEFTKDN